MSDDRQVFYGAWRVEVVHGTLLPSERFVISGSDNADGAYPGQLGAAMTVTGDEWALMAGDIENDGRLSATPIRRSATYDVERGLLVTLAATRAVIAEHYYLVLVCQSEDPTLDPDHPSGTPYDFSIPESFIVR